MVRPAGSFGLSVGYLVLVGFDDEQEVGELDANASGAMYIIMSRPRPSAI